MTAPKDPGTGTVHVLGKQVHNLVIVYDSGVGAEFRVQCEVSLSVEEAQEVMAAISSKDIASLESVKQLVSQKVDKDATQKFRDNVVRAFDDNIACIKSDKC